MFKTTPDGNFVPLANPTSYLFISSSVIFSGRRLKKITNKAILLI